MCSFLKVLILIRVYALRAIQFTLVPGRLVLIHFENLNSKRQDFAVREVKEGCLNGEIRHFKAASSSERAWVILM